MRPYLPSFRPTGWHLRCLLGLAYCMLNGLTPSFHAQIQFDAAREIGGGLKHCRGVSFQDLDGDGDPDALGISSTTPMLVWYENLGQGRFGPQQVVSTEVQMGEAVIAADLDGDGDQDLVSASREDDKVAWYENLGAEVFGPQVVVDAAADGAIDVLADDLDGDGDIDLAAAALWDDAVYVYWNDGAGSFGPRLTITTDANVNRNIESGDLDGDGDLDLMSASRGDDKIAWYKNLGGGVFSAQIVLSSTAVDARWVEDVDLDGDGIVDILTASRNGNLVAWHKGLGGGAFGPQTPISTGGEGSRCATAGDLDGDGDMDILSGSEFDDDFVFIENLGSGVFAAEQHLSSFMDGPWRIFPVDIDGDGDLDAAAGVVQEHRMVWWSNRTGERHPEAPQWIEWRSGFERPVDLDAVEYPDEEQPTWLVSEEAGRIWSVTSVRDLDPVLVLDFSDQCLDQGPGTGLLALALPPSQLVDSLFYAFTAYIDADSNYVLSRWRFSGRKLVNGSEQRLIVVPMTDPSFGGSLLGFLADGYLYAGIGDGGQPHLAQAPNVLNGKLLRLEVLDADSIYAPSDNPFVGEPGVHPAILAIGLRAPQGLDQRPGSEQLFLTDAGLSAQELYVFKNAGALARSNLGWPCLDADSPLDPSACISPLPPLPPFDAYPNAGAAQIGAGRFYDGRQMKDLQNRYLNADRRTGDFLTASPAGLQRAQKSMRSDVVAWLRDASGEILAADYANGHLLRLVQPCTANRGVANTYREPQAPSAINLWWSELPGAVAYRVELEEIGASTTMHYTDRQRLRYYTETLTPGSTYTWTVEAQCTDSTWSPPSPRDTFLFPDGGTPAPVDTSSARLLLLSQSADGVVLESMLDAADGPAQLLVVGMDGRIWWSRPIKGEFGPKHWTIATTAWPPGRYSVVLQGDGYRRESGFVR